MGRGVDVGDGIEAGEIVGKGVDGVTVGKGVDGVTQLAKEQTE